MTDKNGGIRTRFEDAYLLDGVRTPFIDYRGDLAPVSPIDLGIKVAREVIARTGVDAADVDTTIAGCMAPGSFDFFVTPRHIGLYAGVPVERPAHLVQRICGTGIEVLSQAADLVSTGRAELVLSVGTESMSRNPIAAFEHRNGFNLGQVSFHDFLLEALLDPAGPCTMGDTAENLAKKYGITREETDAYASRSFDRAIRARDDAFLDGEIVEITNEEFALEGYASRGIKLGRKVEAVSKDSHIRPSPIDVLAKLRPSFGGVQTGGNSSAIVDGAAGALVGSKSYAERKSITPLAKLHVAASVGVPPEIMGFGPAPAIRAVLDESGMTLDQIDLVELNEAFGAQVLACARDLGLEEAKLNVNGGSIAIGHPLAATGIRITTTLARELKRSGKRFGIASACIGGGQGIAILIENTDAAA